MSRETATIHAKCTATPDCVGLFEIEQVWEAGGVNDRGGWVVECAVCSQPNHVRIGRDVNDSRMVSGGKKLDAYDDELGDKGEVLKRHGLS